MKKPTRADRFRVVRDAILPLLPRAPRTARSGYRLAVGQFAIQYHPPGACGILRGHNLCVWPGARVDCGMIVHGGKLCNVDWNGRDEIDILNFRPGRWDEELLGLLTSDSNLIFMPRG